MTPAAAAKRSSAMKTSLGRRARPTTDHSHVSDEVTISAQALQAAAAAQTPAGPSRAMACSSTSSDSSAQSLTQPRMDRL